jgi:hypothetical protein
MVFIKKLKSCILSSEKLAKKDKPITITGSVVR